MEPLSILAIIESIAVLGVIIYYSRNVIPWSSCQSGRFEPFMKPYSE
jgi:hypothetical protein